jgi:hypothetical protein
MKVPLGNPVPVCGVQEMAGRYGSQLIIGQVFCPTSGRQILKLHVLRQHRGHDLEVFMRAIFPHALDHRNTVGVEVVGEGLQKALACEPLGLPAGLPLWPG